MKNIIKKERVQLSQTGPTAGAARSHPHPAGGQAPRLIRAGGRVAAIELTCCCGKVSLLELEYEDEEPAS